ncbi:MAG: DUF4058 family protein [Anaerolineae bacterium]|nr:DUF4058 family protein [Anaerolineae bacterium]
MPTYLPNNPYHGINAHLHSVLQTIEDGWSEFHGGHVCHIAEAINALLPLTFLVAIEKSWQFRDPIDTEEAYYSAVAIRQITSNNQIGQVVAWLELLSPSNKRGGSGEAQYHHKRAQALHGGIILIELDYLHHTPPIMRRIPSYPDGDEGVYPYNISLTDPRPDLKMGKLRVYGFGVDTPIPTIEIPLLNDDKITVDFDAVYQRTFTSLRAYSLRADYDQLPQPINAYHPQDRPKIEVVMHRALKK